MHLKLPHPHIECKPTNEIWKLQCVKVGGNTFQLNFWINQFTFNFITAFSLPEVSHLINPKSNEGKKLSAFHVF